MANEIVLVTKARNEGLYLLEWVAYHLRIGFDKILVVTNDLGDGSDELLGRLSSEPYFAWIDVTNQPLDGRKIGERSHLAATDFVLDSGCAWVMNLDLDEFLVLPSGQSIQEYLRKFEDSDLVVFHWRNFTSSGLIRRDVDGLVTTDFTEASPTRVVKRQDIKSIARRRSIVKIGAHFPTFLTDAVRIRHSCGSLIKSEADGVDPADAVYFNPRVEGVSYSGGQVNHYSVKSVEEYIYRQSRGDAATRASGDNPKYHFSYFKRRNIGGERDTSVIEAVPDLSERVASLSRNLGLCDAIQLIRNRYGQTVERLTSNSLVYDTLARFIVNGLSDLSWDDFAGSIVAKRDEEFCWQVVRELVRSPHRSVDPDEINELLNSNPPPSKSLEAEIRSLVARSR